MGDISYLSAIDSKTAVIPKVEPKAASSSEPASSPPSGAAAAGKNGQLFMDQATGEYYFQPSESSNMTVMATAPDATLISAADSTQVRNQVMLNTGGDQYQTVTIVPSEGNSSEVSYVLILQQPEEKDKSQGESRIGVYDFDAEGDVEFTENEGTEDEKKVSKGTIKRSQTVTQAHMCNYCNYTTSKRYLLSRHMKSHSEERPHKCSVCERGFKTLASLQNHVNTHTGTKPHRCRFCEASFTTSGELVRHVRYRHTHEKPHRCTECEYSSVELSKLKRHMRCHTGERPYQCSHCTYASPDTFKLKRHLRIHTGEKPYECDICHARFTQSNSLKAHRSIHTGDKPVFQCEYCPTTCGRKTDLRLHVQKLHTSERPMVCKMCNKAFPDRYTLKIHKRSHEGEKCFKCDLCPYSSISQRHLESHMLIHTDQKPFQCDQCEQRFRQRQLLKRHQNLYHNPSYVQPAPKEKTHECPECGRSFRHKGNLIRHMAHHDPESLVQEKALALKLGRQKKIQIIDGQQVEVVTGEDDDTEDEDEDEEEEEEDEDEEEEDEEEEDDGEEDGEEQEEVANESEKPKASSSKMTLQQGKQFVILEVIEIKDEANSHHTRSKKTNRSKRLSASSSEVVAKPVTKGGAPKEELVRKQSDIANCFGFDEEDDLVDEFGLA